MKKGSLNLSIQAIVIVVLGMTLLGLGLGFIRNQFQQIGDIGTEVQGQVREQIISQLRTSGEEVSFPRSVNIGRNKAKVLTLGVQNTGSKELAFILTFNFDAGNSDNINGRPYLKSVPPATSNNGLFRLRHQTGCLRLSPAQSEVYGINVEAPGEPGTFALRATVTSNPNANCLPSGRLASSYVLADTTIYATKLSFLTVG